MDSGDVKLIPPSEGVNEEKNIETIFQAPDTRLHVKKKKEAGKELKPAVVEREGSESDAFLPPLTSAASSGDPQNSRTKDANKEHENQGSHHGTVHVVDVAGTKNEACSVEVVAHDFGSHRLNDVDLGQSLGQSNDGKNAAALVVGTR